MLAITLLAGIAELMSILLLFAAAVCGLALIMEYAEAVRRDRKDRENYHRRKRKNSSN